MFPRKILVVFARMSNHIAFVDVRLVAVWTMSSRLDVAFGRRGRLMSMARSCRYSITTTKQYNGIGCLEKLSPI